MARKQWTPKTEESPSLFNLRERRKWQIALRRYVLEGNKSFSYAPYFGLDQTKFREWIEVQFDHELTWDNFSQNWQFDHVVSLTYFDFTSEEDLRLCWNFINIRVAKIDEGSKVDRVDALVAKTYFSELYQQTNYHLCQAMINKIQTIEAAQTSSLAAVSLFIRNNQDYLEAVKTLSAEDFERLNTGTELKALLYEKEFLKKFGS
ncbi:MAG: hypothetical protein M3Q06_03540 [Bacteroidota bacterium]|nr:hypothetical protein [Bacteroidota bacterium]